MSGVTKILLLILIMVGLTFITRYLFTPQPLLFHSISTDWQELNFTTSLKNEQNLNAQNIATVDLTGGGLIGGKAQLFGLSIGSQVNNDNRISWIDPFSIRSTNPLRLTLFNISDLSWFYDFDPEKERYFLTFRDNATRILFDWQAPFNQLPRELEDRIVYKSPDLETIILVPGDPDNWENAIASPSVVMISDEPANFGWNLRRGCNEVISDQYDNIAGKQNSVYFKEVCPANREFEDPLLEAKDDRSRLRIAAGSRLQGFGSLVVIPQSLSMTIDNFGEVSDTGSDYLVFIDVNESGSLIEIQPQANEFSYFINLVPDLFQKDDQLLSIDPTTKKMLIRGAVGKFALGTESTDSDELSSLDITFKDWPQFAEQTRFVRNDLGRDNLTRFFSGYGYVVSVKLNDVEFVKTPWANLSVEIRAAIISALVSAFVAMIIFLLENRQKSGHSETDHTSINTEKSVNLIREDQTANIRNNNDINSDTKRSENWLWVFLLGFLIGFSLRNQHITKRIFNSSNKN